MSVNFRSLNFPLTHLNQLIYEILRLQIRGWQADWTHEVSDVGGTRKFDNRNVVSEFLVVVLSRQSNALCVDYLGWIRALSMLAVNISAEIMLAKLHNRTAKEKFERNSFAITVLDLQ